jgi:hypothetical protein
MAGIMSEFEYVMVLVSIVIVLAIARLLTALAEGIHRFRGHGEPIKGLAAWYAPDSTGIDALSPAEVRAGNQLSACAHLSKRSTWRSLKNWMQSSANTIWPHYVVV